MAVYGIDRELTEQTLHSSASHSGFDKKLVCRAENTQIDNTITRFSATVL